MTTYLSAGAVVVAAIVAGGQAVINYATEPDPPVALSLVDHDYVLVKLEAENGFPVSIGEEICATWEWMGGDERRAVQHCFRLVLPEGSDLNRD